MLCQKDKKLMFLEKFMLLLIQKNLQRCFMIATFVICVTLVKASIKSVIHSYYLERFFNWKV